MTRIQIVYYSLIGSALVLGAMLVVQLAAHATPSAYGDMVVREKDMVFLTAQTRDDNQDSLFVIDNRSGQLIVYVPEIGRRRLTPKMFRDLNVMFGGDQGGRSGGNKRGGSRRSR